MKEPTLRTGSLEALSALGSSAETLWTRIAPVLQQGTRRSIVFVGADHGAGTSTVAACTAAGLARHLRAKVLLVELGAGRPGLAPLLGLPEGPGLAEMLRDGVPAGACVCGSGLEGLEIVTAGRGAVPVGGLASERATRVFEELGAGRDFLLVDAPPIQLHTELHAVLMHAREAVVVLDADRTQRDAARGLLDILGRAGLSVLGCVLNRARHSPFD
jgi:Mrp family chromosome partitioning ATPase